MSISALANVFNSVYINIKGIEVLVLSRELAKDSGFMRPKRPSFNTFICEFFAGVALPHYAPKRDYLIIDAAFKWPRISWQHHRLTNRVI